MSSPSDSSIANSLRTGEGGTPRSPRSTSPFSLTVWPLVTYCSTTRRRIRRWRSVRGVARLICRGKRSLAGGRSGEELGRGAAAEEAAARRQHERAAVRLGVDLRQPEALEPGGRTSVERRLQPRQRQRLVEAQAEKNALGTPRLGVDLLQLPRRRFSSFDRR